MSAVNWRIFYKSIVLAALLLPAAAPFGPGAALAAAADNVTDYHLAIDLHPAEQTLRGTVTLMLTGSEETARFRLAPQAIVEQVEVAGAAAAYTFRNGTLAVDTRHPGGRQPRQLTIRYQARFADPPPAETVGVEDPSFGVGATIFLQGTYLSAGTPWFPQREGERGRHRIEVTAPAGVVAITAGRLMTSTTSVNRTTTVWHNDFPLDGVALAAGHYQIAREELDGIQLLTFLSVENAALAPGYLAAMRRHLAYYRDLLGPYPFAKFAVVENFLPTGFGLPSWTLLGKSVIRLPFLLDTSLPHEIVHSWWGNAVEVDDRGGNWCEGLATYLADYLLKERDNPPEALDYRRKLLRDYAALVTPENDFPLRAFRGRMAKYQQAVGYGKGAMVFHMLRQEVGDQAFWNALRRMAVEGNGRSLGWEDIERIFSTVAGRELRWFFRQWVEQSGAPELTLAEVRTERTGAGWTVSGVVRQHGAPYRLTLPLQLTSDEGEINRLEVPLSGDRTPFRLRVASRPTLLTADPASDLFRRLAPGELPATVNDLLAPRRPLIVIAEGQDRLFEAARDLLKGVHWDNATVVGEASLDPSELAGRDVLLFGWPRREALHPALPPELAIDPAPPFAWRDTRGDTLFAVFKRPGPAAAIIALFLAGTPADAAAVAAKIPHYGRYSLLLFSRGRNTVKTTWEPPSSPLTIDLTKEAPL